MGLVKGAIYFTHQFINDITRRKKGKEYVKCILILQSIIPCSKVIRITKKKFPDGNKTSGNDTNNQR